MECSKHKGEKASNLIFRLFVFIFITTELLFSMVFALVTQILCGLIFFPLVVFSKKARLTIFGFCFKFAMYLIFTPLNPFWRLKIIRKPRKGYSPTGTLLFFNHLSSLDPWVAAASTLWWCTKFVFKSSLFKIPMGGLILYLAGDIPIYFTQGKGGWEVKPGGVEDIMKKCKKYKDLNISTVVFPEGTRSLNGQLQLFKSGFFRYAIENNCEILPCAIHGTNNMWPVKGKMLDIGTAYVSFGEPFYSTENMTVDELKEKTRNAIFELIKDFPDYDPERDTLSTEITRIRGHGI
ncbi:1-acyl-sn-glycerol-3-phosphate acyltransferase, putative [Plasmodium malariae]|uniref:1-acyl-sn-glycerol-3-phosphate acyltransferase, putative n=1 Tax=Plasmodium malariae TaxID=5858 RepID=A0A1D3TDN2_PLAMA|nr:1-acyl-sn-glycerol-3-phosphate acyltransferase, putative [Plasmodium malariae]SCP02924.1 1-acyl-sn-glycerol-3-phosphate acyltransferase, putative [Plasmodium malariae]